MKSVHGRYRYQITAVILFLLCWLFPYTGDDWAWGSQMGVERLLCWFDNYNGRYLGNLIVMILTRSNFLKAAAMSVTLTGILFLLERLVSTGWTFSLSAFVLLAMPRTLLRQAVVWTSGFTNYSISACLMLMLFKEIYDVFAGCDAVCGDGMCAECKNQAQENVKMLLLGSAGALIVEHITIYSIMAIVCAAVTTWMRQRRICAKQVFYLTGAISGAAYMFSNSVYRSIASGNDSYRTIATSITSLLEQMASNYFGVMQKEAYQNNVLLNLMLFAICFLLFRNIEARISSRKHMFLTACLTLMLLDLVYVMGLEDILPLSPQSNQILSGILALLSVLSLFAFVLTIGRGQPNYGKMVFLIGSIVFICAELLPVTPLGSRCFLITYLLFLMLLLELIHYFPDHKPAPVLRKMIHTGIALILAAYFVIFGSIYQVDRARLKETRKRVAQGEKVIPIQNEPYDSFLWCSVPGGEIWGPRYKLFYGIPEDVILIPVDYLP